MSPGLITVGIFILGAFQAVALFIMNSARMDRQRRDDALNIRLDRQDARLEEIKSVVGRAAQDSAVTADRVRGHGEAIRDLWEKFGVVRRTQDRNTRPGE